MSYNNRVYYFRDLLARITFPTDDTITETAYKIYHQGLDVIRLYRGDDYILMQALKIFLATEVRPYVYAGAAKIMAAISYIGGDQFDRTGMENAMVLLRQAQQYGPDRFEIQIVELQLMSMKKEFASLRRALNKLQSHPQFGHDFSCAVLEMDFWESKSNLRKVREWYQTALERAQNDIHRLTVYSVYADVLSKNKLYKESLQIYEEVVKLDPDDAWAWHNMSISCLQQGDIEKAGIYNHNALSIGQFGAAQHILQQLVEKWVKQRQKDTLQEVPRYLATTQSDPVEEQSTSKLIDRLLGKTPS